MLNLPKLDLLKGLRTHDSQVQGEKHWIHMPTWMQGEEQGVVD